jgi:hypothetical protein
MFIKPFQLESEALLVKGRMILALQDVVAPL